jgi:uncharacterized protein
VNPDDPTPPGQPENPPTPSSEFPPSAEFPASAALEAQVLPPQKFVPEDLRVPWGWLDLLWFVLAVIAGTFVLGFLVGIGLSLAGGNITDLRLSSRKEGVINIIFEVVLFAAILAFLAALVRVRFRKPFWRTIGWRPFEEGRVPSFVTCLGFLAGGCALGIFVGIVSDFFGTRAKPPMEKLFQDPVVAGLLLALSVLMAPVVEETIFRGYLYPVVARSFGQGIGVVSVGIVFGALHAAQLWGDWTQIVLLVIVGIVLTYARAATRTVLASFLLHFSYNSFISVMFLLQSHGLRALPPAQ